MKNIVFTIAKHCAETTKEYLQKKHGFESISIVEDNESIVSTFSSVKTLIRNFFYILKNRKSFNKADNLVVYGSTAIAFMIFKKLGIIKVKRLYWYGFFIHNPKKIKLFFRIFKLIKSKNCFLVLFSKYEKSLYSKYINSSYFRFIPFGYMEKIFKENNEEEEDYYFAGGYSNRDYESVIDVFSKNGKKLVIIGSRLNKDLDIDNIPDNIKIIKDVPTDVFEKTLKKAKACIIPFKYNTGASGQMVVLSCMMYKKAVIASDTDVIKEYIDDGVNGLIVKNIKEELNDAVTKLEDEKLRRDLALNLYNKFIEHFTYEKVTEKISELIDEEYIF